MPYTSIFVEKYDVSYVAIPGDAKTNSELIEKEVQQVRNQAEAHWPEDEGFSLENLEKKSDSIIKSFQAGIPRADVFADERAVIANAAQKYPGKAISILEVRVPQSHLAQSLVKIDLINKLNSVKGYSKEQVVELAHGNQSRPRGG
jgi:hypothetical protein